MQDLHDTDQETYAAVDDAGYARPTRQLELDHTRSGTVDLSASKDLGHERFVNDLQMVCPRCVQFFLHQEH